MLGLPISIYLSWGFFFFLIPIFFEAYDVIRSMVLAPIFENKNMDSRWLMIPIDK